MENKLNSIQINYKELKRHLLREALHLLPKWLPGGKLVGKEYTCSGLSGGSGSSLKVNVETGVWADFATGEDRGGDLIDLFAKINNISNFEAARQLDSKLEFKPSLTPKVDLKPQPSVPPPRPSVPPPENLDTPEMVHRKHGKPSAFWAYKTKQGKPLFYISRYDTKEGKKEFLPWRWDSEQKAWVNKAWGHPRPIYGLELLDPTAARPVLITEGEKACDAARVLLGKTYDAVSWSGGSAAYDKTDWSVLRGRKVLIWPDRDKPGMAVVHGQGKRRGLGAILNEICPQVKYLNLEGEDGFDAADALKDGWDYDKTVQWARPLACVYTPPIQPEVMSDEVPWPTEEPHVPASMPVQALTERPRGPQVFELPPQANGPPEDSRLLTESAYSFYERIGVSMNRSGTPYKSLANILAVLKGLPVFAESIWYDEFYDMNFTDRDFRTLEKLSTPRTLEDEIDYVNICALLEKELGFNTLNPSLVQKAIRAAARSTIRNEPKEWMESLKWDGVPRVESFFREFLVSEKDREYERAVAKNFWVSMVARTYMPGCKMDNMLIIEGKQGIYKSTTLQVIGGKYYKQLSESISSKDFYIGLKGKLLIEFAELDAFGKADTAVIKKEISSPSDNYRGLFQTANKEHPRRCVFVGTTNDETYLKDTTGARRFWPIKIGQINIQALREQREQLFAEAVHMFKAGAKWHEVPEDQATEEQDSRYEDDPRITLIEEYLTGKDQVRLYDVAWGALEISIDRFEKRQQMEVAKMMRRLGWENRVLRSFGKNTKMWIRSEKKSLVPDPPPVKVYAPSQLQ